MIKLMDLLKENLSSIYSYGCVMLYFDFPELFKIQDYINSEDLYEEEGDNSYGLENEPHTTLLYGLHEEVSDNDVKNVLNNFTFSTCKVYDISTFNNPKYDVLKFNVKGENLHKCNSELKQYPYTSDFPDYHPHLTVGYLQPGSGKKYVDKFKDIQFDLTPKYAVYSKPLGDKTKIKINID